jgi:hypothetical protein
MLYGGQLAASFGVAKVDEFIAEAPMAIFESMDGLEVVMKLPQIFWNAKARSGPRFLAGGPKSAK